MVAPGDAFQLKVGVKVVTGTPGGGAKTFSVIGTVTCCDVNGVWNCKEVVYVPGTKLVKEEFIDFMEFLGFVMLLALLGLIPAAIAQSKSRSFVRWWLYGAALFIVALPHSLIISKDTQEIERKQLASGGSKVCPFCAEVIKAEAKVCRFCGRDLPVVTREDQLFQKWQNEDKGGGFSPKFP